MIDILTQKLWIQERKYLWPNHKLIRITVLRIEVIFQNKFFGSSKDKTFKLLSTDTKRGRLLNKAQTSNIRKQEIWTVNVKVHSWKVQKVENITTNSQKNREHPHVC